MLYKNKTAVIDADPMVYIVAYHFKESRDLSDLMFLEMKCQTLLDSILTATSCEDYVAAFSSSFYHRTEIYKYANYKGERGDKPEWLTFWSPYIKEYYTKIGFVRAAEGYEADDFLYHTYVHAENPEMLVYCSPDKDMKQIPGVHYDYGQSKLVVVSELQAAKMFYTLMLEGDTSDNITGVPGIGPVKAQALLEPCLEWSDMYLVVLNKYIAAFGAYYGGIIFDETFNTVRLYSW